MTWGRVFSWVGVGGLRQVVAVWVQEPAFAGYDISGRLTRSDRNPTTGPGWVDGVCHHRPGGSSPNFSSPVDLSGPWVLWHTLDEEEDCSTDFEQYWWAALDTPSAARTARAAAGPVDLIAELRFHPDRFTVGGLPQGGFMATAGGQGSLVGATVARIEVLGGDATELVIDGVRHAVFEGMALDVDMPTNTPLSANGSLKVRLVGSNPGVEAEVGAYDLDATLRPMLTAAGIPSGAQFSARVVHNEDGERFLMVESPETGLHAGAVIREDDRFDLMPALGGVSGRILNVAPDHLRVHIDGHSVLVFPHE